MKKEIKEERMQNLIERDERGENIRRAGFPFFLFSLLFFFGLQAQAGGTTLDWHAIEARGDEKAVLVLCPGMNSDGIHFLKEQPWLDFARENRLGLIAIHFRSDPESLYGPEREGYYWPEQGSGLVLLSAVEAEYGSDLPILIYGFSGGAQFTSRFVEWVPERIVAWAAYSAQFWDSPRPSETNPPGIVACGELDGSRWFPSYSYFFKGRELGKPWTWVSIPETGHRRKGPFEQFVRRYFGTVLKASFEDRVHMADIDTRESESVTGVGELQPGLFSWLPDEALLKDWKSIHQH